MKIRLLGASLLTILAAVASGQSTYNVPFAFHVGEQELAEGAYVVSFDHVAGGFLKIAPEGGGGIMVLTQNSIQAPAPAPAGKLLFQCYGTACFLSQVWSAGSNQGVQLRESKAAREMAKARPSTRTTVLAAVR